MVNTMLDQISNMNELVIKYAKGIEALKISTKVYKQLKQEYQPHYEFLREGQHDETLEKIRELSRDYPVCFSEMLLPIKIFQSSEGHLICENCVKKIIESAQICPFCREDVVPSPIRNRALEEVMRNESRQHIGAVNLFLDNVIDA